MATSPIKIGIGRRIALLVSSAVIAAVLFVAGLIAVLKTVESVYLKRNAVEGMAYVFASAVADHVHDRKINEIRMVLRSVERVPGVLSASVFSQHGELLGSLGQRAILKSNLVNSDPGFWEMMTRGIAPVSVDIIKNARPVGKLVLVTDISDLRANFLRTMAEVFLASLAAAIGSVLLSIPLQRRIANPIHSLTASMTRIKETRDFSASIEAKGEDEMGAMVESFNSLLSDIRVRDHSLQELAYFDPLTGLPNRSNFRETLERMLAALSESHKCLTLIQLNIDSFHTFNDVFGHAIGDEILKAVAKKIKREVSNDAIVARIGGDEFAVILEDGSGQQAENAMAAIQSAFYKPLSVLDLELHLVIAAGATLLPRDGATVADAMRHADVAVNVAKKVDASKAAVFSPEMADRIRRETELGQGLRMAIQNRELQVHYQPQFHIASARIQSYEALLRWKHPQFGSVSPSLFIPLAEKTGTIVVLGDWILTESCRQARSWINQGAPPRAVAVNVSPAQILQSGFVGKVARALQKAELPAKLLCIELTESLFLGRSFASIRIILNELRDLGVTLALDDFGTGFSSLSYLSQLPFDKLKIDRSFVTGAHNDARRREILSSIITMAHSLDMQVVAEGAEIEQEISLLRNLKADLIQGFGIARPSEADMALLTATRIEALANANEFVAGA